jgi:hypothetical protein
MSLPYSPNGHHVHRPGVACLACQRGRRQVGSDWPPGWWCWHYGQPWTWTAAERSTWAPEWAETRLLLGWPS